MWMPQVIAVLKSKEVPHAGGNAGITRRCHAAIVGLAQITHTLISEGQDNSPRVILRGVINDD